MKTLSCDLCDATAEAESFEGWMKALMPHYQKAHQDVMQKHADDPEAGKAAQQVWMQENMTRWEAA